MDPVDLIPQMISLLFIKALWVRYSPLKAFRGRNKYLSAALDNKKMEEEGIKKGLLIKKVIRHFRRQSTFLVRTFLLLSRMSCTLLVINRDEIDMY